MNNKKTDYRRSKRSSSRRSSSSDKSKQNKDQKLVLSQEQIEFLPSASVTLHPGRERSLLSGHPWLFSGAIAHCKEVKTGEAVWIFDSELQPIGTGLYNEQSQIRVRVLESKPQTQLPAQAYWQRLLESAWERRSRLHELAGTNSYRLVHSESDQLPGLVVDRYGDYLSIQLSSVGIEKQAQLIVDFFLQKREWRGIILRQDSVIAEKEGLQLKEQILHGELPDHPIEIQESFIRYSVDLQHGHKTGFYLDQRENRMIARDFMFGDCLNAHCYSGAFAMAAALGPRASQLSKVTQLDSSAKAIELSKENWKLNGLSDSLCDWEEANIAQFLRSCRDQRRFFDSIVLDPPKFAFHRDQVPQALRAYKDINLLAMKCLKPHGNLISFSCSGSVERDQFNQMLEYAASDAKARMARVATLGQPEDHPVLIGFPQAEYLKGAVLRRLS